MIACYCNFTEDQIDNFSYVFYKDLIQELGVRFRFESISNLYGNAYAGKSYTSIEESNPFNFKGEKHQRLNTPKATLGLLQSLGLFNNNNKK